ncbi:hypothetical protein J4219_04330 [Candidatus Woesearchaeota archaeon]|nr:hypothetical protein [Candidatus Woesearchaeota archaeon]
MSDFQSNYVLLGNVFAGALTFALWDYFGDLRFHASGLVVSLVSDALLGNSMAGCRGELDSLCERAGKLSEEITVEKCSAVDDIAKGYLDSALDECRGIESAAKGADASKPELSQRMVNKFLCLAIPPAAYVQCVFAYFISRDLNAQLEKSKQEFSGAFDEANKYRAWAKERNDALGERNV